MNKILITGVGLDFPEGYAPTAQAREIAYGLRSLGYDPRFAPLGKSNHPNGKSRGLFEGVYYQYAFKRRNIFHLGFNLPGAGFIIPILASLKLAFHIYRNRRELDAVFDLSNHTIPLLFLVVTCKLAKIPFVYFLWEEVFSHRIHRQSNPGLRFIHRIVSYVEKPILYGFVLKKVNILCYLTTNFRDYMQKWGYDDRQLLRFPVVKFSAEKSEVRTLIKSKVNKDIVYSGTINTQKDEFISVLDVLSNLKEDYPSLRFRIFGARIESDSKTIIEKEARKRGVWDQVIFEGWKENEVLQQAQNEALVLLVLKKDCSFNRFNFPSRILEYIDAKRPVILTDIPNHRMFFEDGKNAYLVEDGNVDQLEDRIRRCLTEQDEVERIVSSASELLHREFDSSANLAILLSSLGLPLDCKCKETGASE